MSKRKPRKRDQGPQRSGGFPEIEATAAGKTDRPEHTALPGPGERGTPIRVVPASEIGANPSNPFDALPTAERYSRFVLLLAEIHRSRAAGKEKDAA